MWVMQFPPKICQCSKLFLGVMTSDRLRAQWVFPWLRPCSVLSHMCDMSVFPYGKRERGFFLITQWHQSSSLCCCRQECPHSSCFISIYIFTFTHLRPDSTSIKIPTFLEALSLPATGYMRNVINLFGTRPIWNKYCLNMTYLLSPYTSSDFLSLTSAL